MKNQNRTYIAIDLKSYYASVECVSRNLDPMTTNLVVADQTRTEKTICLAVSPALKRLGVPGRPRLFEVVQKVKEINAERKYKAPDHKQCGTSFNSLELQNNPALAVDYIIAPPRMSYYITQSTTIYEIYMKYVAPEDIHVYSIDEVFMDVTNYLKSSGLSAHEFAKKIIKDVLQQTGITATAGIGSNLYLAKIAMDIVAKHVEPDKDGVCIAELDEIGKPYLILLNCTEPDSEPAHALAAQMEEVYHHPVCPINAVNLTAEQLNNILQKLLYEFPLREIAVSMPSWVTMLEPGHWLQSSVYQALLELAGSVHKMGDMTRGKPQLNCANTTGVTLTGMDLACGQVQLRVGIEPDIFFKILGEETDLPITDEASLLPCMLELAKAKAAYDKIKSALEQVQATGYGIVMPGIEELHLEEPEIVRQGGQYGVRLSASAPSLHLMRATIHTELSPTVGSEEQGETLIQGLLKDFESDPSKLWSTNIFGKSLNELVNEGLQAKLMHMPAEARTRLQQTLERIINDGCDGLICILL